MEKGVRDFNNARNKIASKTYSYNKTVNDLLEQGYTKGYSSMDYEFYTKGKNVVTLLTKSGLNKIDSMFRRKGMLDYTSNEATLFGNRPQYDGGKYMKYMLDNPTTVKLVK